MWVVQFCHFIPILVVLTSSLAEEEAVPPCRPKACHKDGDSEKAICGSDGLTYPNRCLFERARCQNKTLQLTRRGPCRPQRPCPQWPVPSSNTSLEFHAQCREDGSYDAIQCHPGTGSCWCVTPDGLPLKYTAMRRKPQAQPKCGLRRRGSKTAKRRSPRRKNRKCRQPDKAIFNNNLMNSLHRSVEREALAPLGDGDSMVIEWTFRKLDQNRDNVLDSSEYSNFTRLTKTIKPKRCAKNFVQMCDQDEDHLIGWKEWDDCLTRDGMDARRGQDALFPASSSSGGVLDEDVGDYIDEPFSKSPPHGVLTPGQMDNRPNYDDDSMETIEEDPPDCISDRTAALAEDNQLYVPECTTDGRYKKIQCYKSAGYCWCVNEDSGKNIPGTSVKNGTPNCDQLKTLNKTMKGCPDPKKAIFLRELLQMFHSKMSAVINSTSNFNGLAWIASKEEQAATWSFVMFDKNKNKLLERNEWKAFKEMVSNIKGLRKCGKKLPRYCDINKDRQISMTEWLECLNVQQETAARSPKTQNTLSLLMED